MLVSQFVDGISAEFSLVPNGNDLTATFHYELTAFEDKEGIFHWDGEIGASIGAYSEYFQQTNDRPMGVQFVATLTPGSNTMASYFVNDNIGGASLDHEFNIVLFTTAANFVGTSAADLVFGSAGADEFRSNGPGDMFEGGAGNDLYRIYSADTKVFEGTGQGTNDRIAAGVSYILGSGVQVEQLTTNGSTGTSNINLTGNELAQTIIGNDGDNMLRDGARAGDVLIGRGGNDTYRIYSATTTIQEFAGQGERDQVAAGVSYLLATGVDIEKLTTNGANGTSRINLTGNELGQMIYGNKGDNVLNDGGGAAVLTGGGGRDTYVINNSNSKIITSNDGFLDHVQTSVSYVLSESVTVGSLASTDENGTSPINLTGNTGWQYIYGNDGDNRIDGRGGTDSGYSDTITGGGGNDTFVLSVKDKFGNTHIVDFDPSDDTIEIHQSAFGALSSIGGVLDPAAFAVGPIGVPRPASVQLIYDPNSGELYIKNSGGTHPIAHLSEGLAMTSADFTII